MTKIAEKLLKIGNRAIKKAQETNRKRRFLMYTPLTVNLFLNFRMVNLQRNTVFNNL